jgi:hypothetical protein
MWSSIRSEATFSCLVGWGVEGSPIHSSRVTDNRKAPLCLKCLVFGKFDYPLARRGLPLTEVRSMSVGFSSQRLVAKP